MITVPPPSSCRASPTSVSLMLRIRLRRKVRLQVSRLIISQRLGILNTLIQSLYENNEGEEKCPKGSNRRKFSPSHGSPLYVWDPDDQSWMLRAGRCVDSSTARS